MTTDASELTADALVERLFTSSLAAMDIFAVTLGLELGLYRSLADEGPATPAELARRTGLNERYVREWLEQQAVTGLLGYSANGTDRSYSLSPGAAEVLLQEESLNYVAPFAPMVTSLGMALPSVKEAFRTGGGVPWSAYGPGMVMGQGAINRPFFVNRLCQECLPQIEGLVDTLSKPGARIADVGAGVGWSAIAMAAAFPNAAITAIDPDEPSLATGRRNAEARGVASRIDFRCEDAGALEGQGTFDLVTAFECIHDMSNPVSVLRSMRSLAKPGGTVLVMDEKVEDEFSGPVGDVERIMYGWSLLCCLPAGMSETPSAQTGTVMRLPTLERYAREAGFQGVDVLAIEDEFFRFYKLV